MKEDGARKKQLKIELYRPEEITYVSFLEENKGKKVLIKNFPKDVFNLMMSLSREVVAETALEGKINKDIYNSWNKFKQNAIKRSPFNEHGYTNLSNNS